MSLCLLLFVVSIWISFFLYDLDFSFVKIFFRSYEEFVCVYGFVLGRTKVSAWVQRFNGPGLPNPMHVRSQAQPNGCQSASMLPYWPAAHLHATARKEVLKKK